MKKQFLSQRLTAVSHSQSNEKTQQELIHRYNPRWAEMSGSSDSEEESPAVCKRKAKKAKR